MTTMLDKVAVAGDITQAIDRRGVWTCAITVIGGASNTAVKVQSADSADGVFTDFVTLISADDASADQYKGFVLDLYGAKAFVKVTGATMATAVFGDCDHDVKSIAIKAGEVPSSAELETNKTASISANGTVEIKPSDGYDAMKKVTATVSVGCTLYAWKSSGETVMTGYTLSATPSANDDFYLADSGLAKLSVDEVGESAVTVTVEEVPTAFSRSLADDVVLM